MHVTSCRSANIVLVRTSLCRVTGGEGLVVGTGGETIDEETV